MASYHYDNPHISLSGTLGFLQSASSVEVQEASDLSYALGSTDFIDLGDEGYPLNLEPKGPTAEVVHHAYEAFLTHFEKSPSVEGSVAICWQPLSFLIRQGYKFDGEASRAALEIQKSYLRPLEKIVRQVKPEIEPDGNVLDKDAVIFIHLSVGLILLNEQVNGGQSEQQWEWLDDALRIYRMTETKSVVPFAEQTRFPRTTSLSDEIAKALLLSKSASRSFRQHRYEEALRDYTVALLGIWTANEDIFYWLGNEDELPDDKRHTEFVVDNAFKDDLLVNLEGEPLSGGSSLWGILDGVFDFNNAVKAFDALIDQNTRDTNWELMASYCQVFSYSWQLSSTPVSSKHIPKRENANAFWSVAQGLVLQKMTPDALADMFAAIRDKEAETRLSLYFFGETWDSLPAKARAALISADREYENLRGWRPVIFENLCLATRELLVEVLLKPFNEFCSTRKELKGQSATLAPSEYESLYKTAKQLYNAPIFEDFLEQSFSSDNRKFIRELESAIRRLNPLRNDAVHNHRRTLQSFENDIRKTYAEFLGIGLPGVLPRLMRLHTKVKPTARSRHSS